MRLSAAEPDTVDTSQDALCNDGGSGQYNTIDPTPSTLWQSIKLILTVLMVLGFFFGFVSLVLPYFVEMSKDDRKAMKEIRIGVNSIKLVHNITSVNWLKILSKDNLHKLTMVGTGRHPDSSDKLWYVGMEYGYPYLIQKDYTMELLLDRLAVITDIEQDEAAAACRKYGTGYRLPTYAELQLADHYATLKDEQNDSAFGGIGDKMKPNLRLNIVAGMSLWTSTPEGTGFMNRDNFRIYDPGMSDKRYEDDGYDSPQLSFLCVYQPAE